MGRWHQGKDKSGVEGQESRTHKIYSCQLKILEKTVLLVEDQKV